MNQEKIGKFISTMRKKKDLTQEQLAEKLNVSKNAVSKWERGLNLPDASIMQDVCSILDISLNELFAGEKLNKDEQIKHSEQTIINILKNQKHRNKIYKIKGAFQLLFYFISCSRLSNKSVSKNSRMLMPKPSQIFLMETTPGFWLFSFSIL